MRLEDWEDWIKDPFKKLVTHKYRVVKYIEKPKLLHYKSTADLLVEAVTDGRITEEEFEYRKQFLT